MAQRTSGSRLAAHSRFERLREQHIEKHGYISCTTAMAAAAERLAKGEPEVALMFCDLSRQLLEQSEVYVRTVVGAGSPQPQAA
jgi:hypothetical protein